MRHYMMTMMMMRRSETGTYRVVQKSGHPIYFCYNFSK